MIKLLVLAALLFSGCSHFRITGTMCDDINTQGGDIPQECQAYSEEKADKAFNKVTEDKKVSNKDLEFDNKEE